MNALVSVVRTEGRLGPLTVLVLNTEEISTIKIHIITQFSFLYQIWGAHYAYSNICQFFGKKTRRRPQ